MYFFLNWAIHGLFFLLSSIQFIHLTVGKCLITNSGPLIVEVTALPTVSLLMADLAATTPPPPPPTPPPTTTPPPPTTTPPPPTPPPPTTPPTTSPPPTTTPTTTTRLLIVVAVVPQFFIMFLSFLFLKMGHSRPLFSLFSSFQYTVDSKQMFNI